MFPKYDQFNDAGVSLSLYVAAYFLVKLKIFRSQALIAMARTSSPRMCLGTRWIERASAISPGAERSVETHIIACHCRTVILVTAEEVVLWPTKAASLAIGEWMWEVRHTEHIICIKIVVFGLSSSVELFRKALAP
jgi:hypothetical protein